MKCSPCKGTGYVEIEYGAPDNHILEMCTECKGSGKRNIILQVVLWDEDNDQEIATETVPTISYEQGAEAVARLVKYAQEN